MFKRNAAVTGFQIGHFIQTADGIAKTTGTPACKRLLDGTPGTLTNAASYDSTAGVWKIDLAAADTNGDMVGLSFTLADCLPIGYTFRTTTKLVSDLNDAVGGDTSGTTTLLTRVVGTLAAGTHNPQTGDAFARLGAPAGASVSVDIADLPTVTEFNARTLAAADYTVVSDLPAAPDNASITAILEDTGTTLDALIKDVPTNAELATALAGADDATLAAISALNNLSSAQAQSAAAAALTAYDPPTNAEMEARTLLAANYFDPAADVVAHVTLVDTTTTNTDMVAEAPKTAEIKTALEGDGGKLDHLWEMTEDDGGVRRLTTNALELAPTGGSAPTAAAIRAEIDANSTQLAAIVADTGELQTDWTNGGRLDTLLDSAAAGGGLDAAGVRSAVGLATANLDTQLATVAKTGADSDTLKTLSDQIDGVVAGSGLTTDETKAAVVAAINSLQQLDEVLEQSPAGALAALFDDNAIDTVTGLPTVVGQGADATGFAAWVAREFDGKLFIGVAHAPTLSTAAVVGSLSSISDTPTFEYMLPEEGVQTMIVGPDNRLYVAGLDERNNATDIQSVYIRDTAGTWTKKQTINNESYHVYGLAFQGTRLWAGLGGNMYPTVETKVAYSDDYGDTWNFDSIMSLGDVWDVAVLGSTVILQVWHNVNNIPGVWYSTNAGATWTQVAGIVAHTARLVVWNNLVVGASNDGYMFTVNASGVGTQYTIPFSVTGAPRNRSVVDSEGYLCVAATSGIWRTKDLLTWKRIWTPLPGGTSIKMLGRFGDSLVVSTNNTTAVLYSRPSSAEAAQQQMTRDAMKLAASPGSPATGSIDDDLDKTLNGLTGVGLIPLVYTVTEPDGITPIAGTTVELYTEQACLNCVRRGVTNSFGVVTFWMSTAGTYWIKSAKDGYSFELDSETVAA